MKIDEEKFVTACEDADIRPYIRYSGRYMYGKTCVGIVGDARDMMRFTLHVIKEVDPDFEVNEEEWLDMRSDNMGTEMIYYWPEIDTEKNDEDPDK